MNFPPPTDGQARLIWLALSGLAIAVLVGLAAALVWGLGQIVQILSPVLWPLAIAGVLAYLLDPVVDVLERKAVPRPRAIILVFCVALMMVATFFASIVPQLVSETRQLAARIPAYADRAQKRLEYWATHPPPLLKKLFEKEEANVRRLESAPLTNSPGPVASRNPADLSIAPTNSPALVERSLDRSTLETATGWVAKVLPEIGGWVFGHVGRVASWLGVVAGLALIPVYSFYFLLEKQGISSRWSDYLPLTDSWFKTELVFVLNSINNYLIAFFAARSWWRFAMASCTDSAS